MPNSVKSFGATASRSSSTIYRSPQKPKLKAFGEPIPIVDSTGEYTSPSLRGTSFSETRTTEKFQSVDYHVKLVCVGDGGCGKTSMMVTYAQGTFPEDYIPTVFENYLAKVKAPSGKLVEVALWDTAGQEEYDRLRALSYPEVDVVLVCFGIDSPSSLANVYDKWLPEVRHYCPGVPFILVGLKMDLRQNERIISELRHKGQRIVTYQEGNTIASKHGAYQYMECSARTQQGVSEIFNSAIALVIHEDYQSSSSGPGRALPSLPTSQKQSAPKRKSKKCIIL